MDRQRLDAHDRMPEGIRAYLEKNGWSFSKKMCEFAVGRMKDRSGKKLDPISREQVTKLLEAYGVELKHDNGYDAVYVANMAKSDYMGSSVPGEQYLALFIKDYIDDEDAYPGLPFTRYFADIIGSGTNVPWEDVL